jgi:hypothetical protein
MSDADDLIALRRMAELEDKASQSPPIRPMQPPGFVDQYVAPLLEKVMGSNPQGSPLGRLVQGAADPALGVMQMGANAVGLGNQVNQKLHDIEGDYQSQRAIAGSTGFDPLRMAGNVGTALMAPTAPSGSMLANGLRAAGTGAAYGLAQPVTDAQPGGSENYGNQKLAQAGTGAVMGPVGAALGSGLAKVAQPAIGAAQQVLMNAGATLTPGQIMGGGVKRLEDAATSWPFVGDFIRRAQNRTLTDFQRAAYARALDPIGVDSSNIPAGPDGVLQVKQALSDAYDKLLPNLTFDVKTITPQLSQLRQMASGMPQQEAAQFNAILDKNLGQLTNGTADGVTFKQITGNLGTQAKSFGSSTDAYQRQLGDALSQAQSLFRQGLTASNPDQAAALNAIDTGYANYARIRQAAASAGDKSNGFTPAQLASAIRAQDKTVGKGATATGQALMQDLSNAGREVLPSSVADSGTPFRAAVGSLATLAGAHVAGGELAHVGGMLAGPIAGMAGVATLPYTKLGQAAMQKILAERPGYAASVAAMLRQGGPLLGAAATPAITNGQ